MRERLSAHHGDVYWSDLSAHAARDALIVVRDELDLIDVGVAMAQNDAEQIGAWIAAAKLSKPSAVELARWPSEPLALFESLVVAPWVLIRPRVKIAPPPAN